MSDVAREAGVARVTVSRVLSEPGSVAPATRAAVQAAIERLGYLPNLNAGTLASQRSHIVGCIVPSLSNAWFADTIDGLGDVLAGAGYQLLLGQTRYDLAAEERLIDTFLGRQVDAVVVTGANHTPGAREKLRRAGMPVVETWDLPTDPIDMGVGFSHEQAGALAADRLLARGCRQLGFIGADEIRARKRLAGLQAAVARHGGGVPVEITLCPAPSSFEDGTAGMQLLKQQRPALDGVFCGNDTLAIGALAACRHSGWRVPQDIAVVGFSDHAIAAAAVPALTTVRVRSLELGREAGRLLLQRLDGQADDPRGSLRDLGVCLIERESA